MSRDQVFFRDAFMPAAQFSDVHEIQKELASQNTDVVSKGTADLKLNSLAEKFIGSPRNAQKPVLPETRGTFDIAIRWSSLSPSEMAGEVTRSSGNLSHLGDCKCESDFPHFASDIRLVVGFEFAIQPLHISCPWIRYNKTTALYTMVPQAAYLPRRP